MNVKLCLLEVTMSREIIGREKNKIIILFVKVLENSFHFNIREIIIITTLTNFGNKTVLYCNKIEVTY